jgi:hypothetical protein
MMKFANSNWNSNLIISLTVRATQTEENSDYNGNNGDHDDNKNLIRNDKNSNTDDNSSSDNPIWYLGIRKRFVIKIPANRIVKHFRVDQKAIGFKCQEA